MGRLWQALILSRWNPLFANIPVETLVHEHQSDYYQALQRSTKQTDSAPFIEFMLQMIFDAIPRAQSDAVLSALAQGPLSANELISRINLRSKTGAFKRTGKYLLEDGLIEYTLPDKPNSRLQKYRLTEEGKDRLTEGENTLPHPHPDPPIERERKKGNKDI